MASPRFKQGLPEEREHGRLYDEALAGLHETVGGIDAFRRISKRFHRKVEADPEIRRLFPANMHALEERLALFLAELTGGPSLYSTARGKTSLGCRHAHLPIGIDDAERWIGLMSAAIAEEGVDEATRDRLLTSLADIAATLSDPCVPYYHLPLAMLREQLERNPSIAKLGGLLIAAATAWDVPRMRLLIDLGADIDARDPGGHNALYRAANGRGCEEDGRTALALLIEHGADVNQVTGVGSMTALHMSSRRGTTLVAAALLDAGADIEAKDRSGETPLRRAVNCGQEAMVRLLLSRGADPHSMDRRGRTPIEAARSDNVRRALREQTGGSA